MSATDYTRLTVADLLKAVDRHIRDNQGTADIQASRGAWIDAHQSLEVAQAYRRARVMIAATATSELRYQAARHGRRAPVPPATDQEATE